MGERIIVTDDDEPKPAPDIIVIKEQPKPKTEKVVTKKTTIVERKTE